MPTFQYSQLTLEKLESAFSVSRLARYKTLAGGDLNLALELHVWNAELGQGLHLPMQHFELLLRNAFNDRLTSLHGDAWFDVLFEDFQPEFQRQISAAKDELAKQKRNVVTPSVIAQFTLGTWVAMLAPSYDDLLWKFCLYQSFANPPVPFSRKTAKKALEKIRMLRNRIAHHEPIYHRALDKDLEHLISVAGWICPDTAQWIDDHCFSFRHAWARQSELYSMANENSIADYSARYELIDWTR